MADAERKADDNMQLKEIIAECEAMRDEARAFEVKSVPIPVIPALRALVSFLLMGEGGSCGCVLP